MAEILEKAKAYLKCLYEKVIVATAIAVIRTKPQNLTIEEHIETLKSSIITPRGEKNCDYEDIICTKNDFTDIPSQQTALFSKLWAVFPNDSQEKSTENKITENHDSDEEMGKEIANAFSSVDVNVVPILVNYLIEVSQDLFVNESVENHADDDSDGAEDADVNMRFIQAIVQLKSIINSRSSVPAKKFQDILELFVSSGESGLDVEGRLSFQNESVSCCALRFVMRSSETNDLIKFSLQKVLSYLSQSINSSWWDGDDDTSLISHAIKTVKQLLDVASAGNECMGFCLETCLKFVTDLVDEIYNGTEINKGEIWERYCMVIIELCKCRYMCVNTISHTMEIILSVCEEFESSPKQERNSENGCCCGPSFSPYRLENSWYLLYLAKTLLVYSRKALWANSTNRSCYSEEESDIHKIRDLWRLSWKNNDSHATDVESWNYTPSLASDVMTKWKERLSHFIKNFSQTYPLFTYDLYECEKLLT